VDLSVDLTKESVQYTTGDVLTMYAVIIVVAISVAIIMFKWASRKNSSNNSHK
jgi:prolipoprotein diacylglyceryltransferase